MQLTKEDFELPTLAPKLRELGKEVSQVRCRTLLFTPAYLRLHTVFLAWPMSTG